MSKLLRSSGNGKKAAIVVIVLLLLLCVVGFIAFSFAASNSDKILKGVNVSNISVSIDDMSKERALEKLSEYQQELDRKAFTISYDGSTNQFFGKDIELKVASNELVEKAYKVGKEEGFFQSAISYLKSIFGQEIANLDADYTVNEEQLETYVDKLIAASGTQAVDAKYEINEDNTEIKVTKGHDGITPLYSQLYNSIKEAAGSDELEGAIEVKAEVEAAKDIDFEELYTRTYVPKKNASYEEGGKFTPEQVGISFDKNEAYAKYKVLKADEEMTIALKKENPEITTENLNDILFKDELGRFKTLFNASNLNRSSNLNIAANSINNKILVPGEVFSYNDTLGERTAKNGYKEAHVYSGGEVVDGMGGGICQVSSTLYNSVLLADLEVVERKNHMFYPEYVDPSFDATVAWGSIDFKFKNNRETPIKIVASAKGGVCIVTIYGKKEDDEPKIELVSKVLSKKAPTTITRNDPTLEEGKQVVSQNSVTGYVSEGYKVYKDAIGKEIKRTLISKDTYSPTDKIIKVGTKKVVKPVEPVTPDPVVETTTTVTPEQPTTTTPEQPSTQWPTGWDTPENPTYRG